MVQHWFCFYSIQQERKFYSRKLYLCQSLNASTEAKKNNNKGSLLSVDLVLLTPPISVPGPQALLHITPIPIHIVISSTSSPLLTILSSLMPFSPSLSLASSRSPHLSSSSRCPTTPHPSEIPACHHLASCSSFSSNCHLLLSWKFIKLTDSRGDTFF